MDCRQLQLGIDDYLDGVLPAGEQQLAESHLAGCAACRAELSQIQSLRRSLRNLPVPPPTAGFNARVMGHVRQKQRQRQYLEWGMGAALAASLLLWMGVSFLQPVPPTGGISTIVMGVSDTRHVRLVFNSPEQFAEVTLQLEMSGTIELSGYTGQRDIEWQTSLQKGSNTLVLPITATGNGDAELVARIKHAGHVRTFRIPFKIDGSQAELLINKISV